MEAQAVDVGLGVNALGCAEQGDEFFYGFGPTAHGPDNEGTEEGDLVGKDWPTDQRTGELLDREMAQAGRATELGKMLEHGVFEVKPCRS